jgi:hypothetical protein
MKSLWESVLTEDVKQSGSPETARANKNTNTAFAFTDDNDIPNNALHIAAYYDKPESIHFLLHKVRLLLYLEFLINSIIAQLSKLEILLEILSPL